MLCTPAAHSLHTPRGHALRRTDVAQGLEVSLRNILQDLFIQRQFRYQPLQLAVLLLQFLQSGLWGGFSVRDADFNLSQRRHDLIWFVPLDRHGQLFLQVDSLSFHLAQISPVTSLVLPTLL
jgi:hypothetical protein